MTNVIIIFKYANNIFTIFETIKLIVMKIKLLKDHLDHTAGDTIEVTEQRGGYLVRVGVGTTDERPFKKQVSVPKYNKVVKNNTPFKTEITDKQKKK
jgi:hypothetical protein